MSLSQRPAASFFAAFYRWNIQNQSSRQCAISSPRHRNGEYHTRNSCARSYHATRCFLQEQSETASNRPKPPPFAKTEDVWSFLKRKDDSQLGKQGEQEPATQELDPEDEVIKESLRKLMRGVPSSAAVITAAGVIPETGERVPMGVAVSSLTTVSMNPPMISFNIKEPSKTLDAIRSAKGRFRIHIPSANKGGANVVDLFSSGNHAEAYSTRRKRLMKLWVPLSEKDDNSTPSMAAQIWDDDIQAAMECTVTKEMTVADHVILAARVDSLEKKDIHCPAVLYLHGKYMRLDGTTIKLHVTPAAAQSPLKSALLSKAERIWDCEKFPGDEERRGYVEDIKAFIKSDVKNLETSKEAIRRLGLVLPYIPLQLGIDLFALVSQCRQELGLENPHISATRLENPVSEFYGRLSPSSLETIIDRAKKLVALDSRFLSQEYTMFLQNLGASVGCTNLLASDILNPLRAAGLVDSICNPEEGAAFNILQLERIEKDLIYRARADSRAMFNKLDDLLGDDVRAKFYFQNSRARILKLAWPKSFEHNKADITGHVSLAEIRVILRRIIFFLHPTVEAQFRKHRFLSISEILRRSNIDPTISGADVDYFLLKIRHIYNTTEKFIDFAPKVYALLDPWVTYTVEWPDLQARVKQFVHNMPLRATTWNTADQVSAMGLHTKATVLIPGQDKPQNVQSGFFLATLVAKELRDFYGSGTPEQNEAVAAFLKDTYNYEVHAKPAPPSDMEAGDSGNELREAMMANLNVDVSGRYSKHKEMTKRDEQAERGGLMSGESHLLASMDRGRLGAGGRGRR